MTLSSQRILALCLVLILVNPGHADPPPNILVFFTDDQTFESIGALNNSEIRTPNLDRLVAQGTTFTHAYNMGGWHGALCVASRAMLMTGQSMWPAQDLNWSEAPLWPVLLREAGYQTWMIGKWHNGQETLDLCFPERGPHFVGGMLRTTPADGDGYDRPRDDRADTWSPSDPTRSGMWRSEDGVVVHATEQFADGAIDFLRQHSASEREQPFLLYVAFNAPHDPRQAPARLIERYPAQDIEVPASFAAEHAFEFGERRTRDERLAPYPRTPHAVQVQRAEYYAIIEHLDEQIGRILDNLDANGLTDETLIVFSSDHGLSVGHHGLIGKQNLYEHSARAPLIFVGPGVPANQIIDTPIYLQALMTTTLEAADVSIPASYVFPSLWSAITQKPENAGRTPATSNSHDVHDTHDADPIYLAYRQSVRALRHGDWKLIRYPEVGEIQLFNLEIDPHEIQNLASDPEQAERVAAMSRLLQELMIEHQDPIELED